MYRFPEGTEGYWRCRVGPIAFNRLNSSEWAGAAKPAEETLPRPTSGGCSTPVPPRVHLVTLGGKAQD